MPDAFTLCQECDVPIPAGEPAHWYHDPYDCDRFLTGACRCDGWLCPSCCPEPECTPLAVLLLEAREDTRARAAAADAAYEEVG